AFVPVRPPIRPWADTLPWAALGSAMEHSCETRFPKQSPRGRRPVAVRVLLALAWLKPARGASDEAIWQRLCTDCAVMDAWGLREEQVNPSHAPCVWPETLCECRGRRDEALLEARSARPAAAAMADGLVRPAPLVLETLPREHGRQRGTEA